MRFETITRAADLLRDAASSMFSQTYSDWYNANTMQSFEEWSNTQLKLIEEMNVAAYELEAEWENSNDLQNCTRSS